MHTEGRWGCLESCCMFADSIVLNNSSIVHTCGWGGGGRKVTKLVIFCINVWPTLNTEMAILFIRFLLIRIAIISSEVRWSFEPSGQLSKPILKIINTFSWSSFCYPIPKYLHMTNYIRKTSIKCISSKTPNCKTRIPRKKHSHRQLLRKISCDLMNK